MLKGLLPAFGYNKETVRTSLCKFCNTQSLKVTVYNNAANWNCKMITLWVSSSPSVERKHRKLHTVTCHANVVRTHGEIKNWNCISAVYKQKSMSQISNIWHFGGEFKQVIGGGLFYVSKVVRQ